MIYIIGDSHSLMFRNIQDCIIHPIGPVTMHRIGRDGFNIKDCGISENDIVVFTFGEIDVRCHIGLQRDKYDRDIDEIIETLSENFMQAILENDRQFTNVHYVICSVVPPCNAGYNPEFPFYGTLADRINITKRLNEKLKNKSELNNIGFIDIYDYYSIETGELDLSISDGSVHIHPAHNHWIRASLFGCINKLGFGCNYPNIEDTALFAEDVRRARIGDTVKIDFICRLGDGTIIERSTKSAPFQFTIGKGQTIPGIEQSILGMYSGESKKIRVLPDKAFGHHQTELVFIADNKDFIGDSKPEVGQQFQVDMGNSEKIICRESNVLASSITLDANHPLAGKDLIFEVYLIEII
jgi:peptidylprolyl isomerase